MQKILLLHGALGCANDFDNLTSLLNNQFEVHSFSFFGHGGTDFSDKGFSIESFAKQVLEYLDLHNISTIDIFGYSMGGYVALYLASNYPNRINRIFTFATKFDWNIESAATETKKLNPDIIEAKVPQYALHLQHIHGEDKWKKLLSKTAELMKSLGESNKLDCELLTNTIQDVQLGIGDKDKMVTLEETINIYRCLPNSSLIVFPNTIHPIDKIDCYRLSNEIINFFK